MKSHALETTLGEVIVALTEEVSRSISDKRTAYSVVAYILSDLLRQADPVSRSRHE
jgi:hypothetical protein